MLLSRRQQRLGGTPNASRLRLVVQPRPLHQSCCFAAGPYKLVLSSDEEPFGGWRNVTKDSDVEFFAGLGEHDGRPHSFQACFSLRQRGCVWVRLSGLRLHAVAGRGVSLLRVSSLQGWLGRVAVCLNLPAQVACRAFQR